MKSNLTAIKRLSVFKINRFDKEQATISIVKFKDSPCKRRDNSDVYCRDTGPSTACCRLAVSPSEKKTIILTSGYLRTKRNDPLA